MGVIGVRWFRVGVVVAVVAVMAACSGGEGRGAPEVDGGDEGREAVTWNGPLVVLDGLPSEFDDAPVVTLEEGSGDGWSYGPSPAGEAHGVWVYSGPPIPDLLARTGAEELGPFSSGGVSGLRYRVDPDGVAELIEVAAGGRPPTGLAGGVMGVAESGGRMVVRVDLGLDPETQALVDARPSEEATVSVGVPDRVLTSLRVGGEAGCPQMCAVASLGERLSRDGEDRLRLAWSSPETEVAGTINRGACPAPPEQERERLPDAGGEPDPMSSPARVVEVDGEEIGLYRLTERDGHVGGDFGEQGADEAGGDVGTPIEGVCRDLPTGGSIDIWAVGVPLGDAAWAAVMSGWRAPTGPERDRLLDGAIAVSGHVRGEDDDRTVATPVAVPDPPPDGEPGDVVSQVELRVRPDDGRRHFAIGYLSTTAAGEPVVDTATISVPAGVEEGAGTPVVVAGHGTRPQGDGCSGTLDPAGRVVRLDSIGGPAVGVMEQAVVVRPDYRGNGGTPGPHLYLDGETLARSILDAARAARAFGGDGPVALWGFSEGAAAVLHTGARWPSYAPDVDLRGVVANAVPTRVVQAYAYAGVFLGATAYLGDIVTGVVVSNPQLDPAGLLTDAGLVWLERVLGVERSPFCSPQSAGFDLALLRDDPADLPRWREAFEAINPDRSSIEVPVLLVSNADDTITPPQLADDVCHNLGRLGTDVRLWRYPTGGHGGGDSGPDEQRWIENLLTGAPPDAGRFVGPEPTVRHDCPPADIPPPPDR